MALKNIRRDAVGDPFGSLLDGVAREMGVAGCRLDVAVAEQLADNRMKFAERSALLAKECPGGPGRNADAARRMSRTRDSRRTPSVPLCARPPLRCTRPIEAGGTRGPCFGLRACAPRPFAARRAVVGSLHVCRGRGGGLPRTWCSENGGAKLVHGSGGMIRLRAA